MKPKKPRRRRVQRIPGGPRRGLGSRLMSQRDRTQQMAVMLIRTKIKVVADIWVAERKYLTVSPMRTKNSCEMPTRTRPTFWEMK